MDFLDTNIEYSVDEKQRLIIGSYVFSVEDALSEASVLVGKSFSHQPLIVPADAECFSIKIEKQYPNDIRDEYLEKSSIVLTAIARCHPNDDFDVEKGKKIVRYRLLKKFYTEKERIFIMLREIGLNQVSRFHSVIESTDSGRRIADHKLNILLGHNNKIKCPSCHSTIFADEGYAYCPFCSEEL